MFIVRAVGVFSLLLTLVGGAQAAVMFDNLPPNATISGPDPIAGDGPQQFASFTADLSGNVDTIQLLLDINGSPTGVVEVGIYSDNGNSPLPGPLTQVDAVGTVNENLLGSTASVYTFAGLGITGLTGGDRYWVVLTDVNAANGAPSDLEWYFATDDSGTGVASEFNGATQLGTVANLGDSPYMMCVSNNGAGDVCAVPPPVPEPASLSILGLGLAGLGLLRRRRSA